MGAPSGSGKSRPGSKMDNPEGGREGHGKRVTSSSGTIRSTPIEGSIRKSRQGYAFGPSWEESQKKTSG